MHQAPLHWSLLHIVGRAPNLRGSLNAQEVISIQIFSFLFCVADHRTSDKATASPVGCNTIFLRFRGVRALGRHPLALPPLQGLPSICPLSLTASCSQLHWTDQLPERQLHQDTIVGVGHIHTEKPCTTAYDCVIWSEWLDFSHLGQDFSRGKRQACLAKQRFT